MKGRASVAGAIATMCVVILAGCGGSASKIASQLGTRSITPRVSPPPTSLMSGREISAAPADSARRAFLAMWSALQWQSWLDAISNYQAGLVRQIGQEKLVQAFEFNATLYRATKPKVEGETSNGSRVTVRYVITPPQSEPVPSSITWERVEGRWMIYYDPALDSALRLWAQEQTQQTIDPGAATPSPKAIEAGVHASELQERYLAGQIGGHRP